MCRNRGQNSSSTEQCSVTKKQMLQKVFDNNHMRITQSLEYRAPLKFCAARQLKICIIPWSTHAKVRYKIVTFIFEGKGVLQLLASWIFGSSPPHLQVAHVNQL